VSNPKNSDPFAEGREAHDAGLSETANPYDPESDEFLSWNDGWSAAEDEADGAAS
jgi:hypothetical protein